MSTEAPRTRVHLRGPILSARVVRSGERDPVAAAERARLAEEEARLRAIREEAEETARNEMAARFETVLADLATEREKMRTLQDETLRRLEPHVADLALAIAQQLVAQEIDEGRIDILPAVETVLRELREPGSPTVLEIGLNPDDHAALGSRGPEGTRLTPNASVPRGACLVITDTGRIWSDLESRVRAVRLALRDAIEVPA